MTDPGDTFFGRAIAEAQQGPGRFANAEHSMVTAAGPTYPRLPASSPWSHDPVPAEPPLGFAIDAMPPLGPQNLDAPSLPAPEWQLLPAVETSDGASNHRDQKQEERT